MVKRFFSLWLVMLLAVPAFSQAMIQHPWKGKRVAYFGDSITDPRNSGSKKNGAKKTSSADAACWKMN